MMNRYNLKTAKKLLLILSFRRRGVLSKTPSPKTARAKREGIDDLFNKKTKIAQGVSFRLRAVFDDGVMPRTPYEQFFL